SGLARGQSHTEHQQHGREVCLSSRRSMSTQASLRGGLQVFLRWLLRLLDPHS
uniref:Uncharacterized protein n=1 Tax=Myotis lucifugus TaxID=59463 RepID=G1Q3W8_MYOLU